MSGRLRRLLKRLGRSSPGVESAAVPQRRTTPGVSLADYQHLHPSLLSSSPDHLHPELLELGPDRLPEQPLPGIFLLPVLSEAALAMLVEELDALEAWANAHGVELERPNSMNNQGVVLDQLGYTPLMTQLREALGPVCAALFPELGRGAFDGHHGFVVHYSEAGDRDLGFHVDDSEVTLNLSLPGDFLGGDLYFEGRRCAQHRQLPAREGESVVWSHRPGMGILHAGKHRHGARPIVSGTRRNLILWMRAERWRDSPQGDDWVCHPWCGDHGPRSG